MSEIAIKVENLSKQYRLGQIGTGTISHDLNRWWHQVRGKEDPYLKIGETNDRTTNGNSEYVWALQDINFEVKQGEVLGIIGKNGAGKSTLLKILSKVTSPTTGSIKARGRIASLLEVGTGFHPEMTGRENIFMNGTIMGMNRHEIKAKLDEIVEFAGIAKYLDTPVKRYSSGMTVRLGFAIAAHLEPEILIVDEVLAVGDAEFQKKAIGKMQDVSKGEGRTVLFVSHNLSSVRRLCHSGILMDNGEMKFTGSIDNVLNEYLTLEKSVNNNYTVSEQKTVHHIKSAKIEFVKAEGVNQIKLSIGLSWAYQAKTTHLLIRFMNHENLVIGSHDDIVDSSNQSKIFHFSKEMLNKGTFHISLILYQPGQEVFDKVEQCCHFEIQENPKTLSHLENFNVGYLNINEVSQKDK